MFHKRGNCVFLLFLLGHNETIRLLTLIQIRKFAYWWKYVLIRNVENKQHLILTLNAITSEGMYVNLYFLVHTLRKIIHLSEHNRKHSYF